MNVASLMRCLSLIIERCCGTRARSDVDIKCVVVEFVGVLGEGSERKGIAAPRDLILLEKV